MAALFPTKKVSAAWVIVVFVLLSPPTCDREQLATHISCASVCRVAFLQSGGGQIAASSFGWKKSLQPLATCRHGLSSRRTKASTSDRPYARSCRKPLFGLTARTSAVPATSLMKIRLTSPLGRPHPHQRFFRRAALHDPGSHQAAAPGRVVVRPGHMLAELASLEYRPEVLEHSDCETLSR